MPLKNFYNISMIPGKHLKEFTEALEHILESMNREFQCYDMYSPIYFWLRHIEREKVVASSRYIENREYPHIRDYLGLRKKSIARILKSSEWVELEDISYTNFMLHFIDNVKFFIDDVWPIPRYTYKTIYVPLELKILYESRKLRNANWLYPKKNLE